MNIIRIVLIGLVFSLSVMAEESLKNPFLWEVEKNGQKSYLFGTLHIPSPELSVLPKQVKQAIDHCTGVRTEINMSFMNQMGATQLMLMKDGRTLSKILPKSLYQRSEKYLKSVNPALNLKPFDQMKVWAFSATLGLLKDAMKHPELRAIDIIVYNYGEEQNKSVDGIETIQEQLGYFDTFSQKEQVLMLESTLDYLEKKKDYMLEMKQLYIKGEGKSLINFTKKQFSEKKYQELENKFMEILLYKRNVIMANRMDSLLKEDRNKSYFFAFGAMHFLGEKSVISELKKFNYKIKRIKN